MALLPGQNMISSNEQARFFYCSLEPDPTFSKKKRCSSLYKCFKSLSVSKRDGHQETLVLLLFKYDYGEIGGCRALIHAIGAGIKQHEVSPPGPGDYGMMLER